MNRTCVYSRQPFEHAPEEHILQNFLGGRWASARIVCAEVQARFGSTIDVDFERGLQPIRSMFGTRGGRGGCGPILTALVASSGERIDLEPGFQPRLREPIVRTTPLGDGRCEVHLKLGSPRQFDWAFHLLRQELPGARIDESAFRAAGRSVENYISGTTPVQLSIGGRDYFRGMLKACFNRLAIEFSDAALSTCFDPVRRFILDGTGDLSDFIAWIRTPEQLVVPRLGPIDQFIGMVTRGGA